jgi:hypothetical protein
VCVTFAYQKVAELNINWRKLGKLLHLITVKPRYNGTSLIAHSTMWTEIPSYTLYRFAVWIFCTHLISYACIVIELIFPSGGAHVAVKQSRLSSISLGVWRSTCQVPVVCKKKKTITNFWWVQLLKCNFTGLFFRVRYPQFWVGVSPLCIQ